MYGSFKLKHKNFTLREAFYIYIALYIYIVMVKDLSNVTINSISPFYLIINKINGYTEESNGSRYLTLFPTDESKDTLKKVLFIEQS